MLRIFNTFEKNIPCKQVDFSSLFHMLRIFNTFEKKHPLQASGFFFIISYASHIQCIRKKHPLQASGFFFIISYASHIQCIRKKTSLASKWIFLHYFICFAYSMHSKKNIPCKQVFFFFIIFYILFSVKYGIIEMCMVGVVWPFFREDVRFLSHGFMYDETEDFGSC